MVQIGRNPFDIQAATQKFAARTPQRQAESGQTGHQPALQFGLRQQTASSQGLSGIGGVDRSAAASGGLPPNFGQNVNLNQPDPSRMMGVGRRLSVSA